MALYQDIGVRIRDRIHLELFFICCRCGQSVCSTGIANDYHYPGWYVESPIGYTEDGLVCNACQKGGNRKEI